MSQIRIVLKHVALKENAVPYQKIWISPHMHKTINITELEHST